jgi:hypothetical protein
LALIAPAAAETPDLLVSGSRSDPRECPQTHSGFACEALTRRPAGITLFASRWWCIQRCHLPRGKGGSNRSLPVGTRREAFHQTPRRVRGSTDRDQPAMRIRTATTLAAFSAALLMAVAVSSTSARLLSVSNKGFRITWSQLTFVDEAAMAPVVECPVTLEGSFHSSTFAKIRDLQIGYFTRAITKTEACTGGSAQFLTESLPWRIRYRSFLGMLPSIIDIDTYVAGVRFRRIFERTICLYGESGETRTLAGEFTREAGGQVTTFTWDPTFQLELFMHEILFCDQEASLERAGSVFLLGTTSRIQVRLI